MKAPKKVKQFNKSTVRRVLRMLRPEWPFLLLSLLCAVVSSALLLVIPLLVGNAIAIGIGLLQQKHHLVKLDPDTYYIDFVPINFELWQVLLLNVGVFAACLLVIALPAWFVSRKIQPAKAVRFE